MKIRIDSSHCNSTIQGYSRFDNGMEDYWYYADHLFETGRSYGLVSEYMQGCMYLSYLLGGKIKLEDGLEISVDGRNVQAEDLSMLSWNIEPYYEKYKNLTVRRSIAKALEKNAAEESFEQLAEIFVLTEPRYGRKLSQLSGERWRASTALGYASGRKIFYAPYMPSLFYSRMNMLPEIINFLTSHDCMVLLPVGSDTYIKNCVDECIIITGFSHR
ncbi:MAG: hypothetical protein J6U50_07665 [Lachnospiraceae bacterium]|nr:hypothetical protein [Lachnospiraceae bacterium]